MILVHSLLGPWRDPGREGHYVLASSTTTKAR